MADSLLSVRLLPIEVITKQLDCCTARRSSGSIEVTLVAAPKLAYHSLPRPSSTASVPSGASQRSRLGLALVLAPPAAPPVTAVGLLPVVILPPPGVSQPARARAQAARATGRRKAEEWRMDELVSRWVDEIVGRRGIKDGSTSRSGPRSCNRCSPGPTGPWRLHG